MSSLLINAMKRTVKRRGKSVKKLSSLIPKKTTSPRSVVATCNCGISSNSAVYTLGWASGYSSSQNPTIPSCCTPYFLPYHHLIPPQLPYFSSSTRLPTLPLFHIRLTFTSLRSQRLNRSVGFFDLSHIFHLFLTTCLTSHIFHLFVTTSLTSLISSTSFLQLVWPERSYQQN